MATLESDVPSAQRHLPGPRPFPPVAGFALLGAGLLVFDLYCVVRWVTGDSFARIPTGVDEPPGWMKVAAISAQVAGVLLLVGGLYVFVVRPWLRNRSVSIDALICLVAIVISPFDPLSVYGQHWFTYNTYLLNFGSVMSDVPGVISRNGAGVGQAWPILLMPGVYIAGLLLLAMLGCWVMRTVRARFPSAGPVHLVAACFAFMIVVDVIGEGLIAIPLGFWSYEGAHFSIFGDHWYKYPFQEGLHFALFYSFMAALRFFVNDRGQTLAERGADRVRATDARRIGLRFLATLGVVQLGMIIVYHGPLALWALNSTAWPADAQDKSYFTAGICGAAADRACPGPGVPLTRPGSPYLDFHGRLVTPPR